ncbi:MAG: hypothetical protein M3314_07205 [Actinomycetota bacterium]|nr:hypothetical protein [Actinomycetota bacterium]
MQRLAGNAVTISLLNRGRGTAPGTAGARGVAAQRDIAPGQPLPDTAVIGEKRVRDRLEEREGTRRMDAGFGADLLRVASDKGFVDKLVLEYRNKMEPVIRAKHARAHPDDPDRVLHLVEEELDKKVPSDMDVLIVTGNLLAFLADNPRPTAATTREAMEKFRWMPGEPREWLVRNIINLAEDETRAAVSAQLTQDAAAEWQQIAGRAEGASFGQALTKSEKANFSAALKSLPSLSLVARAHSGDTDALKMTDQSPKWRNGGFLGDDIVEVTQDNDQNPIAAKDFYRTPLDDGTFSRTVWEADKMIRTLVEARVLGLLPRPKIRVHPMKESKFRAFQSGGEVHLAANEPLPIMVHEIGHYLEDKGAIDSWADIQRLLAKRHQQAGGGATTQKGAGGMRREGRYAGEYPVTGKYTSKAYESGSTEVMSMTLEYLARPGTFDKMIEKDPVQAAVVLRAVQPDAYLNQASLRPFDKYLPS